MNLTKHLFFLRNMLLSKDVLQLSNYLDVYHIVIMFAGGIAFDSLFTYGMFVWMLKKQRIQLN